MESAPLTLVGSHSHRHLCSANTPPGPRPCSRGVYSNADCRYHGSDQRTYSSCWRVCKSFGGDWEQGSFEDLEALRGAPSEAIPAVEVSYREPSCGRNFREDCHSLSRSLRAAKPDERWRTGKPSTDAGNSVHSPDSSSNAAS